MSDDNVWTKLALASAEATSKAFNKAYRVSYNQGFDAGNYSNAYEGETLTQERFDAMRATAPGDADFAFGFLVGFFASYEMHEVPSEWRSRVEVARMLYPED